MQKHSSGQESPVKEVDAVSQSAKRVRPIVGKGESNAPAFQAIGAAEFASAKYRADYIIDRVLVEGQPMLIGGPKKSLKTSWALAMAVSMAAARPFLGQFSVPAKRRVLFCSGESALSELQSTARRICRATGIRLATLDGFTVCPTLPRLAQADSMQLFGQLAAKVRPQVVVLDPVYLMMPGADVTNVFKQGEVLASIGRLCQQHGATLILCHHFRTSRSKEFDPADLDDLAYAGFAEFARQWLLVSRSKAYDERQCGLHRLWLRVGGSAGHNSLWMVDVNEGSIDDPHGRCWNVSVERANAARAQASR